MSTITNHLPTAELQALDAAHHMHPFTTNDELAAKGARVITRAKGIYLTDSDGNEILDAMAGLWCVNLGYGRPEMGQVAMRQMNELPFYNTFFGKTGPRQSEPRLLCRFRLRGERYKPAHGPRLLGAKRPARKKPHHQPQECLSRVFGWVRVFGWHDLYA
jgi:hypothetical protein